MDKHHLSVMRRLLMAKKRELEALISIEDDDTLKKQFIEERSQIAHALVRITIGTYGRCHDCGKDIAFNRLKVLPYAERCVICQKFNETLEEHATRTIAL